MKIFTQAVALLLLGFTVLIAATSADARERLRKNETWCLETSNGGSSGGGGTRFECTFETRAQCMESKVSHADQCMRNPQG